MKAIFLGVVDLPADERAAAIDRECGTDAGLRAEVESLLVHHSDESLLEPRQPRTDVEEPAREELAAGQSVGNFRVVKKIGQGGMGAVYEAMHQYIERRAAIKVMHPHLSQNEQYKSRFLNEARAVNLIHHPGLVEIFEFGLLENGAAFAVMEFLLGEPLTERLRRANADGAGLADEGLEIALQIAQAMAAVHEKEIVHRDLKPDNVMVLPDGERPFGVRIKVLDFGAAKLSPSLHGKVRTEAGAIIGTPAYMSPEQCAGEHGVDGKADVYALGVVLYQMLTGELPFRAKLSFDYLAAHMRKAPRPLRDHLPSAPDALSDLLRAMLEKRPDARPSMPEVAIRLEQLLAAPSLAFSLSVRPVPVEGEAHPQAPPVARRSRRFILISGLLALICGGLGAALFLQPGPARQAYSRQPSEAAPRSEPNLASARTVHWNVSSTPSGADVVSDDDKLLGSTPWSVERPLQPGQTTLTLRRPGYQDERIVLSNQLSAERAVPLSPLSPLPLPPSAEPPKVTAKANPALNEPPVPPRERTVKSRAKHNKGTDVEVKLLMD